MGEREDFEKRVVGDLATIIAKLEPIQSKQADHEKRLRFLEKGFWIAIGILGLIEVALKYWR